MICAPRIEEASVFMHSDLWVHCLCYRFCALGNREKVSSVASIFNQCREMFQVLKNSFKTPTFGICGYV